MSWLYLVLSVAVGALAASACNPSPEGAAAGAVAGAVFFVFYVRYREGGVGGR